ncbi:MerR family transcriptional regulator [Saccharothrix sp. AJ9571]|nr:MerR family transcriptional regulator [Saccharothrix sp. AJ9571]
MLIGELADRAKTTTRALRYYEQQGLLRSGRAPNGYRDYDETAVARVGKIRLLLASGLTAEDVRALLPCLDRELTGPVCEDSARIIARRLTVVEEKLAALDTVRAQLADALSRSRSSAGRRSAARPDGPQRTSSPRR